MYVWPDLICGLRDLEEWLKLNQHEDFQAVLGLSPLTREQVIERVLTFDLVLYPQWKPIPSDHDPEQLRLYAGLYEKHKARTPIHVVVQGPIWESSLAHEILQHRLPDVLTGNANAQHEEPWTSISNMAQRELAIEATRCPLTL